MASTMAIPPVATLANFHGPMPGPVHGGYPPQPPVTLHGPVMSGPVVNGNNPQSATLSPPMQAIRVPMVPVGGGCYNDGMEIVWHGEFSRLFSSFFPPHVWYLSITNSAPQEKWKFYRDSAKVRFCCQDCGNGWTSMKGRVTFWFYLNGVTGEGFVQFKLYGQVCKKCNSGKFEYVMWYPEEVSKVMCNLYNKVGQTFYGFLQPPIRIDRRPGRPRNQHNADLCQACRDGECDQGRPVKAIYNFMPPAPSPRAPNTPMPNRAPMLHGATGPIPLVIRQPPIPPHGHIVMQTPMHSSAPSVANALHATRSFITAPVTLTSRVQPILTYSIVTASAKDAPKLTPVPERGVANVVKAEKDPPDASEPVSIKEQSTLKQPTESSAVTIKAPPLVNGAKPKKAPHSPDPKEPATAQKPSYISSTKPVIAASLSRQKIPEARKTTVHVAAKLAAQPSPRNAGKPAPVLKTPISQPRAGEEPKIQEQQTPNASTVNSHASAPRQPLHKLPLQPVNGVAAI